MQPTSRLLGLILAAIVPVGLAQTQSVLDAAPSANTAKPIVFDTVSVKANKSDDAHPGSTLRPDGFDAENITPIWVMYWAFGQGGVRDESYFSGLPGWASSERFDIIAKVAGPDVPVWRNMSDAEKERMIRDVFADRFKLQTHTETHNHPIYALVLAKGGAKLNETAPPPAGKARPSWGGFGHSRTGIVAANMTMAEFAGQLGTMKLGRPVLDETGLTGRYDFKLDFTATPAAAAPSVDGAASAPDSYADIFTAIQEQLGLKLQPSTGPVQTVVIDHMERPSEN
jgi:uncharacterized protein (TIGR03435 family)